MSAIERIELGGTDGHRGEFTEDQAPGLMNEYTVKGATAALIDYQLDAGAEGPVVIAQDTRASGEVLRRAAIAGAAEHGVEVIDLHVAPTPMAQQVAESVGAMATVVLTASHNPASDNGWKGMLGNRKPSKEEVRAISDIFWNRWEQNGNGLTVPAASPNGVYETNRAYREWYRRKVVQDVRNQFGHERPLDGKKIVYDGAFGAAKDVTPNVLRDLGATVEEFSCGDGVINEKCGAADLEGLRSFLSARPELLADPNFLGAVANDGDADRMMGVGVIHRNGEPELVEITGNHAM